MFFKYRLILHISENSDFDCFHYTLFVYNLPTYQSTTVMYLGVSHLTTIKAYSQNNFSNRQSVNNNNNTGPKFDL